MVCDQRRIKNTGSDELQRLAAHRGSGMLELSDGQAREHRPLGKAVASTFTSRRVERWVREHGRCSAAADVPRLLGEISRRNGVPVLSLAGEFEAVLTYLGPGGSGAPPSEMCLALAAQLGPDPLDGAHSVERILEFALAYGAGWFRPVSHGVSGWMDVWGWSADEITRLLGDGIATVHDWLNSNLGLSKKGLASRDAERRAEAEVLAYWLLQPEAPYHLQSVGDRPESAVRAFKKGAALTAQGEAPLYRQPGTKLICGTTGPTQVHFVGSDPARRRYFAGHGCRHAFAAPCTIRVVVQDTETAVCLQETGTRARCLQVQLLPGDRIEFALQRDAVLSRWLCGCGHYDCARRHRVKGWDPWKCPLKRFLDAAVQGSCGGSHCKGIAEGMLYTLMAQEGFYNA
jgi:hypothetical protein